MPLQMLKYCLDTGSASIYYWLHQFIILKPLEWPMTTIIARNK